MTIPKENPRKSVFKDLSNEDIMEAMKTVYGYIDITPSDFQEVYKLAYGYAIKRIQESLTASNLMNTAVISVSEAKPVVQVARLMAEGRISGVPVIDSTRRIKGVISEKDFLYFLNLNHTASMMELVLKYMEQSCCSVDTYGITARDIMSTPGITVNEKATLSEISAIFSKYSINRTPVVNADNQLVGIVTRHDIIDAQVFGGNCSNGE